MVWQDVLKLFKTLPDKKYKTETYSKNIQWAFIHFVKY